MINLFIALSAILFILLIITLACFAWMLITEIEKEKEERKKQK